MKITSSAVESSSSPVVSLLWWLSLLLLLPAANSFVSISSSPMQQQQHQQQQLHAPSTQLLMVASSSTHHDLEENDMQQQHFLNDLDDDTYNIMEQQQQQQQQQQQEDYERQIHALQLRIQELEATHNPTSRQEMMEIMDELRSEVRKANQEASRIQNKARMELEQMRDDYTAMLLHEEEALQAAQTSVNRMSVRVQDLQDTVMELEQERASLRALAKASLSLVKERITRRLGGLFRRRKTNSVFL